MNTTRRRRIEVLADEPLIPAITRIAASAGIVHYTLLPVSGGAGVRGRWRDDQLSGATSKVMLLLVTSEEHADAFVEQLAPMLETHHLLLMVSDVSVVRGHRFD
ncbi:DUF190 domain-containing protein [Sandarakinorhabdus sp. AAP62]|uniref:P-II family nitrogen regulator n=1 Tax=Sandarakinorhabdus sp. AAP62 TaxID=1248916 RepID=UPI0002D51FFB|nr:DUF190 domain-containing protein [Sandarakinorhabdus sp. AAP62]